MSAGVEPLLARDAEARTGCVVVVGGNSIVADPGASARLAPDDLPATLEAGAVLVSGYSLLQSGPEAAARAALERARTDNLAVDVASARLLAAFGVDRFLEATARAGILLANAEEARALTGLDADEAAVALAQQYRVVCVKLGRAGAVAAIGGGDRAGRRGARRRRRHPRRRRRVRRRVPPLPSRGAALDGAPGRLRHGEGSAA